MAVIDDGAFTLISRNGANITRTFPESAPHYRRSPAAAWCSTVKSSPSTMTVSPASPAFNAVGRRTVTSELDTSTAEIAEQLASVW
jgi:hypothetical protein